MSDKKLTDQHKDALKPAAKAADTFGPYIETDPAANAAADEAISIIMGDGPYSEDDDAEWGVPKALLDKAGKALANRYIFAVADEDGEVSVLTSPLRYFIEEGCVTDQTGPISDLIPKGGNLCDSTWEIYDSSVKTAADAAKYMQDCGFFWNKGFQDFIDSSLTEEIAAALKPSATGEKAAPKSGTKPKF
jgi:hypothetical protein